MTVQGCLRQLLTVTLITFRPQRYCFSQFYDMCAHGGRHGGSKRKYGNGGEQSAGYN